MAAYFASPRREYLIAALVALGLALAYAFPATGSFLLLVSVIGSLPTAWGAIESVRDQKINIDTFNVFALIVSFATGQIFSAAFIVLMLDFARLLDWRTASRARNAVEELLRLKPAKAMRETDGAVREVAVEAIHAGDILVIEEGARVPVDGVVTFGGGSMNESPVTGESMPVEKIVGDKLIAGTLSESGTMKMRAMRVGKDSTLEQMAELIREAQKNKSRSERLADRFAAIFLPVVLVVGIVTYFITRNILMTAALFLVACADDMAVAIPLAVTASLGRAAERGVIVKGGEWLGALGRIDTLVLDKTGTLTYGNFAFQDAELAPDISPAEFWTAVAVAEKFSEHPVGRAIFREAAKRVKDIPDPDDVKTYPGSGVQVAFRKKKIAVGDESLFADLGIKLEKKMLATVAGKRKQYGGTTVLVALQLKIVGMVSVADVPREEAKESMGKLKRLGIRIEMFTGDNEAVAAGVSAKLGLDSFKSSLLPEDKLREVEKLARAGRVAMVGDGVNDAPALARADVGIAMGSGGSAVAVESADIVILTDNLARVPEMVALGRRTTSVVNWDMIIWVVTNAAGFLLVFTGFLGPALAAFYNFATDFLPLINSARLFRKKEKE